MSGKEFVGEAITPLGAGDPRPMARGEPAPPAGFRWRGREVRVVRVVERTRETGPSCGEAYVRRHAFRLEMDDGSLWDIYLPRQPPFRWTLRTRQPPGTGSTDAAP
jgi:hypothetical protein